MSRPPARTLTTSAIGRTAYDLNVSAVDGYWILTYQGQPFNLNRVNRYTGQKTYHTTGYTHPGHALRLVDKLNRIFQTTDFDIEKKA